MLSVGLENMTLDVGGFEGDAVVSTYGNKVSHTRIRSWREHNVRDGSENVLRVDDACCRQGEDEVLWGQ